MDNNQIENLEKLMDKGMTLIEARQFDKSLYNIEIKSWTKLKLNGNHFPDDYFDPIHEGIEFFKFENLKRYKELPRQGIITADGTIYVADAYHMEISLWLKCNHVDLTSNLTYVYFPDSKNLSFIAGYDAKKTFYQNNVAKLCDEWNEYIENADYDDSVILTDHQAETILYLAKSFNVKLTQIFNYNENFGMSDNNSWDAKYRMAGIENSRTFDHLLKRVPADLCYITR